MNICSGCLMEVDYFGDELSELCEICLEERYNKISRNNDGIIMYCQKKYDGEYTDFFSSKKEILERGVKKEKINKVGVRETDNEKDCYWAYKSFEDESLQFIRKSHIEVLMCAPDFFRYNINNGLGNVVKVKIRKMLDW